MSVQIYDASAPVTSNPEIVLLQEHVDLAPTEIDIDDNACAKIVSMIEEEGNPGLFLRMFVVGGGCSGFSYGFSFLDEAEVEDDSIVITKGKVRLVVDPLSYTYLAGATIKFKDDLMGARFTIDNPNAASTCGCGNSFSV